MVIHLQTQLVQGSIHIARTQILSLHHSAFTVSAAFSGFLLGSSAFMMARWLLQSRHLLFIKGGGTSPSRLPPTLSDAGLTWPCRCPIGAPALTAFGLCSM